jgi:hypothetical protein
MVMLGWKAGPVQYALIDGYGKEVLPRIRERNRQIVAAST